MGFFSNDIKLLTSFNSKNLEGDGYLLERERERERRTRLPLFKIRAHRAKI
jgi:hypothetical protein